MMTREYVNLCKILVSNQRELVRSFGYCIGWCGDKLYYDSLDKFDEELIERIAEWQNEGQLDDDLTPIEAYHMLITHEVKHEQPFPY